MKKIELLSPAGDFECLKAAINNGADAVYLGLKNFSARAFASNFSNEELVEAVKYAHLRNVKVYVTINTLLTETEFDNAYNDAKFCYENNVDALLIQDLGLFYKLKKDFPNFELHASTQMHIHNLNGVKNAEKLGFSRVVLARESNLNFIREATKENIEIECFVHGAICVSYSGQCLMSSTTKNRSANKGMCAQCCRLKYSLYENDKELVTDTDYLLSTKDMFLLNDVPSLIEAGVSCLKIEGRMKSKAYVGYVTSCYRKAIDAYYNFSEYKLDQTTLDNLKALYNRGFTSSYLHNDNTDIFTNIRPNHLGLKIGEVIENKYSTIFIKLDKEVNQFDGIRIISNNDFGLILNMLKVNGKLQSKAFAGDIIEIQNEEKVKKGDMVVKTLDHILEEKINQQVSKLNPIKLNIILIPNSKVKIKASVYSEYFNYESDELVEEAIKQPISNFDIISCFDSVDNHPYYIEDYKIELENSFISLKKLNDIRRDFYNQLDEYLLNSFQRERNKQANVFSFNIYNEKQDPNINYLNPVINNDSNYFENYNLVSEFGGILLNTAKDAFYSLNISNSYAYEFLLKLGFQNIILSSELTKDQIKFLIDGFKKRTGILIKPYVLTKGNRTLMYMAKNPFKKFVSNKDAKYTLSDGANKFLLKFNDSYTEIIEIKPHILDIKGLNCNEFIY